MKHTGSPILRTVRRPSFHQCCRLSTFRKPRRLGTIGRSPVADGVVLGIGDAVLLRPDPAVLPLHEHFLAIVLSHGVRDLDRQGELALNPDIGLVTVSVNFCAPKSRTRSTEPDPAS